MHELNKGDGFDDAELKINPAAREFAIAASFEKKAGFNVQEIELLTPYAEAEKSALLKSILEKKITFIGLPDHRAVLCAAQFDNGDYLIVTYNQGNFTLASLKLFKGSSLDNLKEISLIGEREEPFYQTTEGTLYLPRFGGNAAPKWQPASQASTPVDRDPESWNSKYFPAEPLRKLDADELAGQITDTRIVGFKTWTQIQNAAQKKTGSQP